MWGVFLIWSIWSFQLTVDMKLLPVVIVLVVSAITFCKCKDGAGGGAGGVEIVEPIPIQVSSK